MNLIYNVILISVQPIDFYIFKHSFFILFPIMVYHTILNIVLCAIE